MTELVVKSSIIYSERRGAVYGPNDEIVIYIPPSYSIIDCKNSYLSLRLLVSGDLKASPSQMAGAYSIFRNITITDGTGQYTLETLDQYAQLQAIYNFYSENETKKNLRILHEGRPIRVVVDGSLGNQYVDAKNATNDCFHQVECLLPLHLSGCLSPDRDTVFPNILTNGLRIRLTLNDATTALQALSAPVYDRNGKEIRTASGASVNKNFADYGGGGYDAPNCYEVAQDSQAGDAEILLKCTADSLSTSGRCLTANVATPAHVFKNGQTIKVDGTNYVIRNCSIDDDGNDNYRLRIELTNVLAANVGAGSPIFVIASSAINTYEVHDIKFITSYVVPPAGYIEKIISGMNKGITMDIKTYQLYQTNISASSQNNSLYINARNNRAKSIISVPFTAKENTMLQDSFIPDRQTVKDYQFILYKILTPDRKVPIDKFNTEQYNAEALREMDLALASADIPVENLYNNYKMFFIGRRLATPGYSYNCNRPDEGEIRLNVNYTAIPDGILMHNYIVHLRQIQITPTGIKIVY